MSSRKKSCAQCRSSKARCSLDVPCRRCDERGLDCKYEQTPRRTAARSLRPIGAALDEDSRGATVPRITNLHLDSGLSSAVVHGENLAAASRSTLEPAPCSSIFEAGLGSTTNSNGTWVDWDLLETHHTSLQPLPNCDLDLLNRTLQELPTTPLSMTFNPSPKNPELRYSESLSWLEDLPQQQNKASQTALVPSQNPVIPPNSSPRDISTQEPDILLSIVPKRLYSNGPFGLRARKATPAYFTSKVLLGQLLAYPSMLAKGSRLPPFIFPRCVLDGMISVTDCSSRGYHQCLPEVLAICCSLVQSFEARTPGSTAFVWRTIYSEIYRIEREYRSFTADELIATLQALAIYNLLQASDLDSVPHNNVKAILSLPLFVAKQLYLLKYDYDTNLIEGAALDRREWVCRETIRRTACLLFGFELLVDLDSKREVSKCSSYHSVAAPCGRKLWEPVSNIEWTARYRDMEDEIRRKPLVLDDLAVMRRATRAGARRTAEDDELMARVSDWCDSLDEFGSLVWMAVMMEFDA